MTDSTIVHTTATGAEIYTIIEAVEPVLVGQKIDHVIMAMLAIAIAGMKPSITEEALAEAINKTSEWISLYLVDEDLSDKLGGMN